MNDRIPQFFTSDLHLGHKNVLEFDKRPFRDVDHMDQVLLNNIKSTVPPGSILYFVGDVGMGDDDRVRRFLGQISDRTLVLVLGNHDKTQNAMLCMGFDVVTYGLVLYVANQRVTVSHCPLRGVWRENTEGMRGANTGENWHGESKQHRFTFNDEGQFHLHGHIHSPNGGKSQRTLGKQYDVGVVANNYRPVSISQIESWIAKYGR